MPVPHRARAERPTDPARVRPPLLRPGRQQPQARAADLHRPRRAPPSTSGSTTSRTSSPSSPTGSATPSTEPVRRGRASRRTGPHRRPRRPGGAIAATAKRVSNWGRWGPDDVRGTMNFLDDAEAPRGGRLVRDGRVVLAVPAVRHGRPAARLAAPHQPGPHHARHRHRRRRWATKGFPHGIGGADDVVAMPLQCSTQWDGLGHIFDHGQAWNGRAADEVVTSARRPGHRHRDRRRRHRRACRPARRRPCSRGPTESFLTASPSPRSTSRRPSSARTDPRPSVAATSSWCAPASSPAPAARGGASTPAAPRPACPSPPPTGCTDSEIAAIATDTWGFEVRPNEFDDAFQPLHQVAIPHIGLFIGEMWDLDALADACAEDGIYDFLLTAAPLPVTGAVGAPVNPIAVR